LRSLSKCSFVVRGAYYPLCSCMGPVLAELGHLMSRQRIYAPLRVSVFGVRFGPVGVAVDVRWFSMCAPCLANYGGGGCRGLACCMVAECLGWCAVFSGSALRVSHGRSPQRSKEGAERPGDGCPCVGAEEICGVTPHN